MNTRAESGRPCSHNVPGSPCYRAERCMARIVTYEDGPTHRSFCPQDLQRRGSACRKLALSDGEKKPIFPEFRSQSHRNTIARDSPIRAKRRHGSPEEHSVRVRISPEYPLHHEKSYRLEIVQHPLKCAEFGHSTLTRLPLAPPLIVQLHIRGQGSIGEADETDMPFLIAQISLYSEDGSTAVDRSSTGSDRHRSERMLYGNLVASPQVLHNLQGRQGVYFLFPDVSIRWRGCYRLTVSLLRLTGQVNIIMADTRSPGGSDGSVLARAQTLPFDVIPRSEYTAPVQTPLTQYFVQQGARMTPSCAQPSSPLV
ncbi:hypothetical protein K474DRAFT_1638264 [Panus rudis PR-1116 ss-1]|nr:hypothetical protein K474DRAFT_1638264 [Panus rudis PR-1116 ss-1]